MAPTPKPAQTSNPPADHQWEEWKECRATIGRLDGVLADLRKFGFSLVTGLLTASSLAGGISNTPRALTFASVAIMVLVLALFGIDRYYQVVLLGAIDRATEIEDAYGNVSITKSIEQRRKKTHSILGTLFLYLAFTLATLLIGLFGGDARLHWLVSVFGIIALISICAYEAYITLRGVPERKAYF